MVEKGYEEFWAPADGEQIVSMLLFRNRIYFATTDGIYRTSEDGETIERVRLAEIGAPDAQKSATGS